METNFEQSNLIYLPVILKLNNPSDKKTYNDLIAKKSIRIHDEIYSQLQELIKCQNPSKKIKTEEYKEYITNHLQQKDINDYGVWVYYPWNERIVHTLDKEEFITVRTNRNQYKITKSEQELLSTKKIGILGLSVGQSIALTMAIERTCGELRLADFDTIELSNLNRVRAPLYNLGLKKTIIAAREILEIDPFLTIKVFNEGLNNDNLDTFFTEDGNLDLFIEVCDGLDMKIQSRYKAKALKIPVVMDTNDRGMLDVERFDLEPNRPVLHGLADGLNPDSIKGLTNEDKIPYILKMVGIDTISTRLKASMMEVEQSINTWPQLASSVTLGGALTTDVCRRILLDQYHDSGRYYLDMEDLIKDKQTLPEVEQQISNPYSQLQNNDIEKITNLYFRTYDKSKHILTELDLDKILNAAVSAPSAGNNQPWKWSINKGTLFLFHDKHRSFSWGDYFEIGSHLSLGAALENVHLQAAALSLKDNIKLFPIEGNSILIAAINFEKTIDIQDKYAIFLAENIYNRHTNRKIGFRNLIPQLFYVQIQNIINNDVRIFHIEAEDEIEELGEIIAECDKIRLLNKLGHEEFYSEIRWTKNEADSTKDGIDIATVDLSMSEIAGLKVGQDWNAVKLINEWEQGNAFKKVSTKSIKSSSSMMLLTIPSLNHEKILQAGRAMERIWIFANAEHNISIQPMLSPVFFFNRLTNGNGEGFSKKEVQSLNTLRKRFFNVFKIDNTEENTEIFLIKLSKADSPKIKSLRRNVLQVFEFNKS